MARARKADDDFVLEFDLDTRCDRCGAEREPEGELVMQGERTTIAEAKTPCECGCTRIRVTFALEAP